MFRWIGHLRPHIFDWIRAGHDLLLPPHCVVCRRDYDLSSETEILCPECLARLGPQQWRGCRRCGGEICDGGILPDRCPLCRKRVLRFDTAVVLGGYRHGLRSVVLRMKRPTHNGLSDAMGRLLVQRRSQELGEHPADMIVPIPMYWTRRLRRGTNSPDIVAERLGKSLKLPVRRLLSRCRNTPPQAMLPPSRRFDNMRGAFRVRGAEKLAGARVWLVDDILTTGATCSEAARTLKQAGAAWVGVAVVARAQGQ